jgi:methyltransferase (TIGR00027 family)
MGTRQVSCTAESMALFRALESAAPSGRRLFSDPLAAFFLQPSRHLAARAAERLPWLRTALIRFVDRRWAGARASAVARTCFIDRLLGEALVADIDQVVILGAGFDSRAYRIPGMERVRVFEIDRREIQQAKCECLRKRLSGWPPHVTFVEIDFLRQSLFDVLASAGFAISRPAFFLWEGVTNYLDSAAVDSTLRFMGTCASGSDVVFTYVHRALLDGSGEFVLSSNVRRLLQHAREPWTFGFYPAELRPYLHERGLELMRDLDAIEYGALCIGAGRDAMKGYEFYHLAAAKVSGRPKTSAKGN